MAERWDAISMVSCSWDFPATGAETGQKYHLQYVINEQGLEDAVGLEKVDIYTDKNGEERIFHVEPLKLTGRDGNNYTFEAELAPQQSGNYRSAVRMYPKNKNLPLQECCAYVSEEQEPASPSGLLLRQVVGVAGSEIIYLGKSAYICAL